MASKKEQTKVEASPAAPASDSVEVTFDSDDNSNDAEPSIDDTVERMRLAAEQDCGGAGQAGFVPGQAALRARRDHAARVGLAPLDRLPGFGHGQRHSEHGAQTRADDGGVGRVGPSVADDHAGQTRGVGGSQNGPQVSRLLDALNQKHGPPRTVVDRQCETLERQAGKPHDTHAAFVAAAERDLCECLRRERHDPGALVGEFLKPAVSVAFRRSGNAVQRLGRDEYLFDRNAGMGRAGKLSSAVDECQARLSPCVRIAQQCRLSHPWIGGAGDGLVRNHGAGAVRGGAAARSRQAKACGRRSRCR